MHFEDVNYGIVCGSDGNISRTTNGGLNWVLQPRVASEDLQALFFVNANTGYSAGRFAQIIKTNNGGLSFLNSNVSIIDKDYKLHQNYPNPFNPVTKISFDIPSKSIVKIIVYDCLGKELKTIINNEFGTGNYKVEFNGLDYPSGVYFYSLIADEVLMDTKKFLLIK